MLWWRLLCLNKLMGSEHIATHRSPTVLQWRVASPNRYMQEPSAPWPTSGFLLQPDLHIVCPCVCVCVCGCDCCECCRYLNVVGGIRPSGCFAAVISASIHCCKHILMHVLVCARRLQVSSSKLACLNSPTAFPVFSQHPHSAPLCLATGSHQEQTLWFSRPQHNIRALEYFFISLTKANISTCIELKLFFPPSILWTMYWLLSLWCEDSPESRAFLDAVSSLKKLLRVSCQTKAHWMGDPIKLFFFFFFSSSSSSSSSHHHRCVFVSVKSEE